ncbi:trypsin-like serine peptidase [Methylocystis sp. JAN1]|uniref:trypsin-like serine peptidase n=1 Tax=Methylocystis sp. JAN1 TaxID=3397211 RepID=UPI003FA22B49
MNIFKALGCAFIGCFLTTVTPASAQVVTNGKITMFQMKVDANASGRLDYQNAIPFPTPQSNVRPQLAPGVQGVGVTPGSSKGSEGTGETRPVQLIPALTPEQLLAKQLKTPAPQEYGTLNHPFTTSRSNAYYNTTTQYYPFRAAGKLFFLIGNSTYVCSASLIKPGVIVTAAHCVANYGANQFYSGWQFVPAYNNGQAPYGTWNGKTAVILTAYYNGSDNCAVSGVVCPDDVAVMDLYTPGGAMPGTTTGWFGYGWDGYGFVNGLTQITQLGYPVALDNGVFQERTDSYGYRDSSLSNNTVIGSLQTGGSSGGPWLVNLGTPPVITGATSFGAAASHNIVVGVTSWGYTDPQYKEQGAAPFTSGNISVLVNYICGISPGKC